MNEVINSNVELWQQIQTEHPEWVPSEIANELIKRLNESFPPKV